MLRRYSKKEVKEYGIVNGYERELIRNKSWEGRKKWGQEVECVRVLGGTQEGERS